MSVSSHSCVLNLNLEAGISSRKCTLKTPSGGKFSGQMKLKLSYLATVTRHMFGVEKVYLTPRAPKVLSSMVATLSCSGAALVPTGALHKVHEILKNYYLHNQKKK